MDKLKLNNSLLSNEKALLELYKINYENIPSSFDELDPDIKDTLKLIDEAYVHNSVSFEEALFLMSRLFGGQKLSNNEFIEDKGVLDSDSFYSALVNDLLDKNKLNELLDTNKINYQMYYDGLNYLSNEEDEELSFSR